MTVPKNDDHVEIVYYFVSSVIRLTHLLLSADKKASLSLNVLVQSCCLPGKDAMCTKNHVPVDRRSSSCTRRCVCPRPPWRDRSSCQVPKDFEA